jgi:hypothetical protein
MHTNVQLIFDCPDLHPKGAAPSSRRETRRRIVEAAVDLHGSVGPALTTVSMVAEWAGFSGTRSMRIFVTNGASTVQRPVICS